MFLDSIKIIFYIFSSLILIEIVIYLFTKLKNFFIYDLKTRKDFLSPDYHKYLNRYESKKPLFKYLPIGFRFFNSEEEEINGVQCNSLGFRCPEFKEKQSNVIRVVLLGGSAAWGSGATNNGNTISGHLEKILNEKYKKSSFKIECINLAQINNYISQDLLNANLFFSKLKPDYVVSFAGWNEIAACYLLNQEKLKKFGTYFMEEVGELGPVSLASYRKELIKKLLLKYLVDNSKIISFFFKKSEKEIYLFDEKKFLEELDLSSKIFVEHMRKFYLMSQGYNFKYIQFLQPHIYKKANLTESEKRITKLYDYVRPVHGGKSFGEFLKNNSIYKEIIKNYKNIENVECFNLENIFEDNKDEIFFTLVHMNDKGYKFIAKNISEILIKKIKN